MLIFADAKLPAAAGKVLSRHGEVVQFLTSGITYAAVSGHPDLFFCQTPGGLVAAPNLPEEYVRKLKDNHIEFVFGNTPVGRVYPATAPYNAVVTGRLLIHPRGLTDPQILSKNPGIKPLRVRQGYSRCNLLALGGNRFICSDGGIHKALVKEGLDPFFVDPSPVVLPGFRNGFFGGCCGVLGHRLFVSGALETLPEHRQLVLYVEQAGFEIVELDAGPLFDGGGILFFWPGHSETVGSAVNL